MHDEKKYGEIKTLSFDCIASRGNQSDDCPEGNDICKLYSSLGTFDEIQ